MTDIVHQICIKERHVWGDILYVCSFYSLCKVCVYSMVFFVKIPEKNILIVLIHGALILQMKKNKREFKRECLIKNKKFYLKNNV